MTRPRWYAPLTALLAGLAAGIAHPPFGLIVGLAGYAVLLLRLEAVRERPLRAAFGLSWLAGLGYFAVSTFWIAEPFLVDVAAHGWMAPFAVVLMAGGLALFWGAAGVAYRALRPRSAWKPLVFAGVFAAAEWLRGHVLTGLPWNLVGETWRAGSAPSQAAALFGAYGLTWITLAIASAPALLMLPVRRLAQAGMLMAAGVALTALYAGGAGRLAAAARTPYAADAPVVRIVQANIDQKDKWKPENLEAVFDAYLDLTGRPAATPPDIVIWPEGALPAVIDDLLAPGSPFAPRLRDAVRPGQTLLMGANRVDADPNGRAGGGDGWLYYNTLLAFRRWAGAARDRRLRQAPPGAVRRVHASGGPGRPPGCPRAGPDARRLLRRPAAAPAGVAGPADRPAADLLRGAVPATGRRKPSGPPDPQHLERRVVRRDQRSVAAPEHRQLSGHRGRLADGALHPNGRLAVIDPQAASRRGGCSAWARGDHRRPPPLAGPAHPLQPDRGGPVRRHAAALGRGLAGGPSPPSAQP